MIQDHPLAPTALVAWFFVIALVFASASGCTSQADQTTIRAQRAQVALTLGASVVEVARPQVVALVPEESREALDHAFAAVGPSVVAAKAAVQAYLDTAADGWQGAIGCVAAAVQSLIDAIRASGLTVGVSNTLTDLLVILDVGAGYAPGDCEP